MSLEQIMTIRDELANLDVPVGSKAWDVVYENAIEAASIMTKEELKQYIDEYVDSLPNVYFGE